MISVDLEDFFREQMKGIVISYLNDPQARFSYNCEN